MKMHYWTDTRYSELHITIYDTKNAHYCRLVLKIDPTSQKVIKIMHDGLANAPSKELIEELYTEKVIDKSVQEITQLIDVYNIIYKE